jgi:hypothetical protein
MTRRRARDEGVKRECERRVREERVLAICEGAQSDRPLNSANALLDLRVHAGRCCAKWSERTRRQNPCGV